MKIEFDPCYVRNYKSLKNDHYSVRELDVILEKLQNEQPLNEYFDHALTGDMQGLRELHVDRKKNSNWLLLYQIVGDVVILIKTGTHDYVLGKKR